MYVNFFFAIEVCKVNIKTLEMSVVSVLNEWNDTSPAGAAYEKRR